MGVVKMTKDEKMAEKVNKNIIYWHKKIIVVN
jgi:hypothetical protein